MSLASGDGGWIRCTFEACISSFAGEIRRRPYHRNCRCALHGRSRCHDGGGSSRSTVSFPLSRSFRGASVATRGAPDAAQGLSCSDNGGLHDAQYSERSFSCFLVHQN
ncbi:hypothetical protein AXF42_Ash005857 [Apostasia shenzhenica]|uniref:Uncharacterized protein n=1 Tax=Apostasia shenzhenica TaxID=1088818 RepID=A0A2I0BCK2_9ASPA|nr:hypothetical protein AXF42_Ash005857 [Apostasia shenzhenica]